MRLLSILSQLLLSLCFITGITLLVYSQVQPDLVVYWTQSPAQRKLAEEVKARESALSEVRVYPLSSEPVELTPAAQFDNVQLTLDL